MVSIPIDKEILVFQRTVSCHERIIYYVRSFVRSERKKDGSIQPAKGERNPSVVNA